MKNIGAYKKICIFVGIILGLTLVAIAYEYINLKYNIGIPCAVNKVFGIYCPGCGLTRALGAMLRLDFIQAFKYNVFSLVLIPLIAIVFVTFIWEYIFDRSSFISKIPVAFWIILLGSFFIYGIVRNFIPVLQPTKCY